jgi:predicted transcriptional regulator
MEVHLTPELFLEAVEKGLKAAERGEFIEEQDMDARIEAMFRSS